MKALLKKYKKLLTGLLCLVLAAAMVVSVVFIAGSRQEPVGVYPFNMVGMDGYWGDTQESYGPVTTDKIQTVYLSDTQSVTEILVKEGDPVKKGDVLMAFDTTLSDLQLERKRLEVEKLKLQLKEAKSELSRIRSMKPMEVPEEPEVTQPPAIDLGKPISGAYVYKKNIVKDHDGLTPERAFICWLRSDTQITTALLDSMRRDLWKYYKLPDLCEHGHLPEQCAFCTPELCEHGNEKAKCPTCNCTHGEDCPICKECQHGEYRIECEICSPELCEEHGLSKEYCPECHACVHGIPAGECKTCYPEICQEHGEIADFCPECHKCVHGKLPGKCTICDCPHGEDCPICHPPEEPEEPEVPEPSLNPEDELTAGLEPVSASGKPYRIQFLANDQVTTTDMEFYVVFKTTLGDTDLGATDLWQGVRVIYKDTQFSQQLFAPAIMDYTQPEMKEDTSVIPEIDFGSGFTAAQIAQMRIDQEKKIKDLEFDIRFATAEHKIMEKEVSDGKVYAEIDGKVVSVLTEEDAKQQSQPVLKVSGGGGFFIQGSISELEKDDLVIGQEVTVNDWNSGGIYTGTVKSVGDFPSIDNYWTGAGNPNTTYYPFTVFVGEEASLQAGSYANIQYSTSASTVGSIYLDKAFLRTEEGKTYAYVRGPQGTLEKRFITTGKSLWGSYLEIRSGLTAQDYIAFPYGKDVKEGAPAEEQDISQLYSY